jgi:hypothetical protein
MAPPGINLCIFCASKQRVCTTSAEPEATSSKEAPHPPLEARWSSSLRQKARLTSPYRDRIYFGGETAP